MKTNNSFSDNLKAVAIFIVMLILCYALGYWSNTCQHEPIINGINTAHKAKVDSLAKTINVKENVIAALKSDIKKLDSVSKIIKPSYRKTKKESRDFIVSNPCDSVGILNAFDSVVQKCDTVIIVDSLQIQKLQLTNENLLSITKDYYLMFKEKDNELTEIKNELFIEKKNVKQEKLKKIAAIAISILSIIGTVFILK